MTSRQYPCLLALERENEKNVVNHPVQKIGIDLNMCRHNDRLKDLYCRDRGWCMLRISHSVPSNEYESHLRYMILTYLHGKNNITRICVGEEYR